ncbi:class I SAM-dependent methyltransferase [Pseudomonas sp. DSP3-2-2]|uniref:class I SAM-dependent methyltransferase n=1 Tax=unclassified Pseudomonas TaxID=196821 RepID=UPI003CEF137B
MQANSFSPNTDASEFPGPYCIDRFTVFQGVLRVSGWLHSPDKTIHQIALQVPGGGLYPLSFGKVSPDLIPHFGQQASQSRFDELIRFSEDRAAIIDCRLVVQFVDGTSALIHRLGNPRHGLTTVFVQMMNSLPATLQEHPRRMLEIGSRARSGVVRRGFAPADWEYSGFDVLAGPNVNVVGDAHQLSQSYPANHFDGVTAFSVFEHLMMPWKVMIEINRIMKPGGIGLFTTHQTWPMHDQPWDFWRFSDESWKALINKPLGFEIVETRLDEPAYTVAARCHPVTAFAEEPDGFLSSSVIFRKISETSLDWPVELKEISDTSYPSATTTL